MSDLAFMPSCIVALFEMLASVIIVKFSHLDCHSKTLVALTLWITITFLIVKDHGYNHTGHLVIIMVGMVGKIGLFFCLCI